MKKRVCGDTIKPWFNSTERTIFMANKTFSESAQAFAVKQALKMLRQPPEECLPKLIE